MELKFNVILMNWRNSLEKNRYNSKHTSPEFQL